MSALIAPDDTPPDAVGEAWTQAHAILSSMEEVGLGERVAGNRVRRWAKRLADALQVIDVAS